MPVSSQISDLFRVLLPRDHPAGWLTMLSAYFDDSGTHDTSDVVLVAGIMGTEWQLTALERLWSPHIENPLYGRKPKLRRHHATDCYNSTNEFSGWTRTETDYFSHQLQTAITDSGVYAYGMACSRKDYEDVVVGDMKGFLGDAEGFCITQCFVRSLEWAQENTFDPEITFVFDSRPSEIQRRAMAIEDAFKRHTPVPKIVGCAFLSSYDIKPLQAADLYAWEVYQHAKQIVIDGTIEPPKRKSLRYMNKNMKMTTQFADRVAIQNIVDYIKKERPTNFIKAASDHFSKFDPSNPDYSPLSGPQPS